jgi:hypothetical protein
VDMPAFSETVQVHGLLTDQLHWTLQAVPVGEVLLGVLLLLSHGGPRKYAMLAWTSSLMSVVALSVYKWMIDAAVLERVGCGCHGQAIERLTHGVGSHTKAIMLGGNALLALIHIPQISAYCSSSPAVR